MAINEDKETAEQLSSVVPQKKPKKVRKPQSEEEFAFQKAQFEETGPEIGTDGWLYEDKTLQHLDKSKKPDRAKMLYACQKAYYDKDYGKCMELVAKAEQLFEVTDDDITERDDLDKKLRKSGKIERHIIDLLQIKYACLSKLNV